MTNRNLINQHMGPLHGSVSKSGIGNPFQSFRAAICQLDDQSVIMGLTWFGPTAAGLGK